MFESAGEMNFGEPYKLRQLHNGSLAVYERVHVVCHQAQLPPGDAAW